MTLAQMITQLNGLAGLDLSDAEATDLLNEGYRELCARSKWLRANSVSLVTVANQEDYTLPTDLYSIREVFVDGVPWEPADDATIAHIRASNLNYYSPTGSYLYWLEADSTGTDHLTLYPTPTESGNTITLIYVRRPTALTTSTEPLTPREFDRFIIFYAQAIAYASLEDDKALYDSYMADFDRGVEQLRRLRNARAGTKPRQMLVLGIHR